MLELMGRVREELTRGLDQELSKVFVVRACARVTIKNEKQKKKNLSPLPL